MVPHVMNGRGKSQNIQGMILLSFLLHALFLSIFLLSPSLPTKKWTFGPVYSVDLVNLPAGTAETKPTASISKELSAPGSRQEALTLKKNEDRPIPLLKQNAPKTESATREKAIEDLKKRMAASPPAAKTASAQPQPQAQAAARGEGTAMDPQVALYYSRIKARVMGQWALPKGVLREHNNLLAVLNVVILRDGTLARLSFEKSSGNRFYDQSAERAVRKASPFPPLPEWVKGSSLEIGLTFP